MRKSRLQMFTDISLGHVSSKNQVSKYLFGKGHELTRNLSTVLCIVIYSDKSKKIIISKDNFFNNVSNMLQSKS